MNEGKVALKKHWLLLIYMVLLMAGFNFMVSTFITLQTPQHLRHLVRHLAPSFRGCKNGIALRGFPDSIPTLLDLLADSLHSPTAPRISIQPCLLTNIISPPMP